MNVKLLTTEQAANLYKRFEHYFVVQPIPVKNDQWIISMETLSKLKTMVIDKVQNNPTLTTKANNLRDFLQGLPTQDTDDFPQFLYDVTDLAERDEYKARFDELNFEDVK
jgi:hypothetical protein